MPEVNQQTAAVAFLACIAMWSLGCACGKLWMFVQTVLSSCVGPWQVFLCIGVPVHAGPGEELARAQHMWALFLAPALGLGLLAGRLVSECMPCVPYCVAMFLWHWG